MKKDTVVFQSVLTPGEKRYTDYGIRKEGATVDPFLQEPAKVDVVRIEVDDDPPAALNDDIPRVDAGSDARGGDHRRRIFLQIFSRSVS